MGMDCHHRHGPAENEDPLTAGTHVRTAEGTGLQDAFMVFLKGISVYATLAREHGLETTEADILLMDGLSSMAMNFDVPEEPLLSMIRDARRIREDLGERFRIAYRKDTGHPFSGELPEHTTWDPGMEKDALLRGIASFSPDRHMGKDHRSICDLLVIGLKGIASYACQAHELDYQDGKIFSFLHRALSSTTDPTLDADRLITLVLEIGELVLRSMKLLDSANADCYGHPEPTDVNIGVGNRPGILISGQGLRDLEDLLNQTRNSGVDVYTHGEMLNSHSYPAFMGFYHFIGNYGGSRWQQNEDFERFHGPIIMSTHCPIPPKGSYSERVFTTGSFSYPGVKRIPEREGDGPRDFTAVIEMAMTCDPPERLGTGFLHTGCGHETLLSNSNSFLREVLLGDIKRFIMVTGCGGGASDREYYSELVRKLPRDTLILTAGCVKYLFNRLDLGEIDGIPRLLDAGQCNDSYSLILMVQELKNHIGVGSINDLPISFTLSLDEQKAVAILLALLHLGTKGIRLGPGFPPFLTPPVMELLTRRFGIRLSTTVDEDLAAMMAGR